jgi:DNA-binding HxlR family transcriptional regulator
MLNTYLLNQCSTIFGKKWRSAVLFELREGPLRFSQVHKRIPGCSVKVLSQTLDELQEQQLIIRKQYSNTIPVRVTYELHPELTHLITIKALFLNEIKQLTYNRRESMNLPEEIRQLLEREYVPQQ